MSNWLDFVVDCACWAVWSTVVAWLGARWSAERVGRESWVTRPRRWEAAGRTWVRLGVRRWRRLIPDARRCFGAGAPRPATGAWAVMIGETRRAELVHWWTLAALPLFAVWNRGILLVAMAVYAVVVNAPCIILQRHNRARLESVVRRRSARPAVP